MVTSLKAWMAAEEFDRTEPAGYYVAGARGWSEIQLRRARRLFGSADEREEWLCSAPEWLEIEDT